MKTARYKITFFSLIISWVMLMCAYIYVRISKPDYPILIHDTTTVAVASMPKIHVHYHVLNGDTVRIDTTFK